MEWKNPSLEKKNGSFEVLSYPCNPFHSFHSFLRVSNLKGRKAAVHENVYVYVFQCGDSMNGPAADRLEMRGSSNDGAAEYFSAKYVPVVQANVSEGKLL